MDFVHSLHFDFELEAICFEPLVSRSLVSFFDTFRLVMFIEAGDVTHRRRGQNRNEEFRDFFQVFYTNFFSTQICVFWPNSARNDQNKNFRKNQNFDPPNFWTSLNFTILKDLITLHPCTKFGEISSKGVRVIRAKASKTDLRPEGIILTRLSRRLQRTCAAPLCTYHESFKSLRRILR